MLESLDAFADQRATLRDAATSSGFTVDFSFHGEPAAREPGFLYLHDGNDAEPLPLPSIEGDRPIGSFTPRVSALGGIDRDFRPTGLSRQPSSFTPRYAGAEVVLSFTPKGTANDSRAVDLAFSSEFLIEGTEGLSHGVDIANLSPFDRRSMNLGVSVGYLGFTLGAMMLRESGGIDPGYSGIDFGLGYEWSAFSTEISVGEYSRIDSRAALAGLDSDFYKLELGAAYAVSERLRVSGGVRLFDYGARFGLDGETADRSGVLYLGTRLNF